MPRDFEEHSECNGAAFAGGQQAQETGDFFRRSRFTLPEAIPMAGRRGAGVECLPLAERVLIGLDGDIQGCLMLGVWICGWGEWATTSSRPQKVVALRLSER